MGPVSTPASIRSSVRPTRSRSPSESAQKHPWALRYSGQMPGCSTVRPAGRHLKDGRFQQGLAAGDHEVGTAAFQECDRLRRIDGAGLEHWHRRRRTEPRRQRGNGVPLELPIPASMCNPVIQAQRQNVQQPPYARTTHLGLDPLHGSITGLGKLHDPRQIAEAGHPGAQAFPIEEGAAMADQVLTGHEEGRLWPPQPSKQTADPPGACPRRSGSRPSPPAVHLGDTPEWTHDVTAQCIRQPRLCRVWPGRYPRERRHLAWLRGADPGAVRDDSPAPVGSRHARAGRNRHGKDGSLRAAHAAPPAYQPTVRAPAPPRTRARADSRARDAGGRGDSQVRTQLRAVRRARLRRRVHVDADPCPEPRRRHRRRDTWPRARPLAAAHAGPRRAARAGARRGRRDARHGLCRRPRRHPRGDARGSPDGAVFRNDARRASSRLPTSTCATPTADHRRAREDGRRKTAAGAPARVCGRPGAEAGGPPARARHGEPLVGAGVLPHAAGSGHARRDAQRPWLPCRRRCTAACSSVSATA